MSVHVLAPFSLCSSNHQSIQRQGGNIERLSRDQIKAMLYKYAKEGIPFGSELIRTLFTRYCPNGNHSSLWEGILMDIHKENVLNKERLENCYKLDPYKTVRNKLDALFSLPHPEEEDLRGSRGFINYMKALNDRLQHVYNQRILAYRRNYPYSSSTNLPPLRTKWEAEKLAILLEHTP